MSVSKLLVHFARSSLQGGCSNSEWDDSCFYDYRFMHHHFTPLAMVWKKWTRTLGDSKFHDAVSGTQKAEGKKLSPNYGVCFAPSVEVGAGRAPTKENILKCFDTNDFYFLYSTLDVDEEKVTGVIYWVPTSLIRVWFEEIGTKSGTICYSKFMKEMETVSVEESPVMRRGFPPA